MTAIEVLSSNHEHADLDSKEVKRRGRLSKTERLAKLNDKAQTKLNYISKERNARMTSSTIYHVKKILTPLQTPRFQSRQHQPVLPILYHLHYHLFLR